MLRTEPGRDPGSKDRPPVTLAIPRVDADDPVGGVVLSVLNVAALRIAGTDADARRGDPEGIHRLRTTTRRLRSELRSLENVIDRRFREQLEGELKWLAGCLGAVRDLDILLARFKKAAAVLDHDGSNEAALRPCLRSSPAAANTPCDRSTTPCGARVTATFWPVSSRQPSTQY